MNLRDEVVVHLCRPDELFAVDPRALLHDPAGARIPPGIDELLDELLARPRRRRNPQLVVTLPSDEVVDDTAPRLTTAVSRWCVQRIEQDERETRVLWRQGLRSLRSGVLLFVIGLLLSSEFLAPICRPSCRRSWATGSSWSSRGSGCGTPWICCSLPASRCGGKFGC